jgi:hypothetical protein
VSWRKTLSRVEEMDWGMVSRVAEMVDLRGSELEA